MPKPSPALEPAHSVIEALGGCTYLAQRLGLTKGAITLWRSPRKDRTRAGNDGIIPLRHWPALKAIAHQKKIEIELVEKPVISPQKVIQIKQ